MRHRSGVLLPNFYEITLLPLTQNIWHDDSGCKLGGGHKKELRGEYTCVSMSPLSVTSQAETHHSSCENRGHTKVPRGFSPSTRLLDLRGNHFHYIPSNSFPGVAQVVSLHLQRCKIVEVEDGAFSGMKGLIYLYLSENDLTSLSPDAFKGLLKAKPNK